MIDWISERKRALLRLVLVIFALINQMLTMTGHKILPISDEQLTDILTNGFTIIAALWAWWKNNSITEEAIQADIFMKNLKIDDEPEKDIETTEEPEMEINLDSSKNGLTPEAMLKGDFE